MSNIVSSAIFCARNVDKAENQDKVGRWAVAVGQGKKVVDYVRTLDNELGKQMNKGVSVLKDFSKQEVLLDYAAKTVNLASKKINPLICISSGIDVLRADDKQSAAITTGSALASMFAVEHVMKKHLDDVTKIKGVEKIAKKVVEFEAKHETKGKIGALIHGVAFVVGSCTAYNVGEKFGSLLTSAPPKNETKTKKIPEQT